MHLLPIILALLSTNAIVTTTQHPSNFQLEKPRSFKVPKSIFITPSFEPCDSGYVQDEDGKCLRLIKIDEPSSKLSLLSRLQNAFVGHEEKKNRLKEQKLREEKLKEHKQSKKEQSQTKANQDRKKTQETLRKVEDEQKKQTQPQKEDEAKEKLLKYEEGQLAQQRQELNEAPKKVEEWKPNASDEHKEQEDQKECRTVEEQAERYSVQSKEPGYVAGYHQYFIENVTTEMFDFVSFKEEITNVYQRNITVTSAPYERNTTSKVGPFYMKIKF